MVRAVPSTAAVVRGIRNGGSHTVLNTRRPAMLKDASAARPRYRSMVEDSARWDGFALRPGDIVIGTPPKCGSAWMQMICRMRARADHLAPNSTQGIWKETRQFFHSG